MASKKTDDSRRLYVLPIAILFGILTFSNGQWASGSGANANLFLQPTMPMFSSPSGLGSFYFAATPVRVNPTYQYNPGSAFLDINYRSKLPTSPTFFYARPSPITFNTYSVIGSPVQPIYYTPTRALFNARYSYDNARQVFGW
ncbi:MAG: hypothetical protein J4400_00650 [Candidatus Aenigmarchaeota archaeon]|nr:hypothetical protein [Candidatus Aenigmarchaeota archaeon]